MKDRWKKSEWVLRNGCVLRVGRRYTAACESRDELGADLPPFWHIAQVLLNGQSIGFGLSRNKGTARSHALWEAGLL